MKRQKGSRSRNIYKTEVCTNLLQEYIHKLKRPAQIRLLMNRSCQDAPRPSLGLKYQLTIRHLSSRMKQSYNLLLPVIVLSSFIIMCHVRWCSCICILVQFCQYFSMLLTRSFLSTYTSLTTISCCHDVPQGPSSHIRNNASIYYC